jgi:hypothetical protein
MSVKPKPQWRPMMLEMPGKNESTAKESLRQKIQPS